MILFSIGCRPGRDRAHLGHGSGSLNRDGGQRRLNVAITRARREMVVFATLRPDRSTSPGPTPAASATSSTSWNMPSAAPGRSRSLRADRPAPRVAVRGRGQGSARGQGWVVHPQVGVSAFRVDLGVVHPDAPGRYLAGVECDGATYHRSATARDRDRLRELVLTDLGWTIRRVWSTDWWHDAGSALDKLHRRLTADCEESRRRIQDDTPAPDIITSGTTLDRDTSIDTVDDGDDESHEPEEGHSTLPPSPAEPRAPVYADMPTPIAPATHGEGPIYSVANLSDCGLVLEAERFYDPLYRSTLRALVAHIIRIEGPIFEDVMIRRVARAHGFARTGDKIRTAVLKAVDPRFPRSQEADRLVYWPAAANSNVLCAFRRSSAAERDHGDVPLIELASLARRHLENGADQDETVRLMARDFGLGTCGNALGSGCFRRLRSQQEIRSRPR